MAQKTELSLKFMLPYLSFRRLQVVPGHYVDQEVKLVKLRYCHGNVIPL